MQSATVSDKGQVVIPAPLRQRLGIKPGSVLDFELDNAGLRIQLRHAATPSQLESGFGMLRAKPSGGKRGKLSAFDVAQAMRESK
jgi:antitoxin PrlF